VTLSNGEKIRVPEHLTKLQMRMILGIPEETEFVKEFNRLRDFFKSGEY